MDTTEQEQNIEVVSTKFRIGEILRHTSYNFRGVVFDVDPSFQGQKEELADILLTNPDAAEQPFYQLLIEDSDLEYVAYIAENNLTADTSSIPIIHSKINDLFFGPVEGIYYRYELLN